MIGRIEKIFSKITIFGIFRKFVEFFGIQNFQNRDNTLCRCDRLENVLDYQYIILNNIQFGGAYKKYEIKSFII